MCMRPNTGHTQTVHMVTFLHKSIQSVIPVIVESGLILLKTWKPKSLSLTLDIRVLFLLSAVSLKLHSQLGNLNHIFIFAVCVPSWCFRFVSCHRLHSHLGDLNFGPNCSDSARDSRSLQNAGRVCDAITFAMPRQNHANKNHTSLKWISRTFLGNTHPTILIEQFCCQKR